MFHIKRTDVVAARRPVDEFFSHGLPRTTGRGTSLEQTGKWNIRADDSSLDTGGRQRHMPGSPSDPRGGQMHAR